MSGSILSIVRFFHLTMVLPLACFTMVLTAKPRVVCTTTIIYDIAKQIAGDKTETICLMPIGGDPHIYEPTPGDAMKIANAQIIFKNGLHLEGWLDKLIANAARSARIVSVSEGITPIVNQNLHASPDPHVWMVPANGAVYATHVAETLADYDPENASFYKKNLQIYQEQLSNLDQYIAQKINTIPLEKRVLITSHDAFRYYGRHYGIRVESALGTSTDAEIQIGDMNRLIDIIAQTGIAAIFIESTINPKVMNQLASDHHVVIGGKLFADSVGDSLSGADTYINMLRQNTDIIVAGLTLKQEIDKDQQHILPLILVTLALFLSAFIWLFLKIKPNKHSKLEWQKYTIEVKNLSVSYERKTVLANINFTLASGKLYGLLGPNGAGKSTLFKSILGLIQPDSGEVLINNKNVHDIRDKIAYIPQKEEIDWSFPATVFDIVLTGRLPLKSQFELYSRADKLKAREAIRKMGLEEFAGRQIGDLSGGQQQRVFIARALCQEAEVLFFDEPFVGVDVTTEEKIIQMIKKLVEENKTVIMIHHDLSKVKEYFDNIIMVNQHLIACGKTKEVFSNENISKTYSGRLSILQETDKYVH